jgi:hypothetical protein
MRKINLAAAALTAAFSFPALADDHVIRPDCWEENHAGVVERHCEVRRPDPPRAATSSPPPIAATPPIEAPPPAYAYARPPIYQSTLPRWYWPDVPQNVYAPPPYPYAYAPPPPDLVFQFGPFRMWIP